MKKKIAGLERPYTFSEFQRKMENMAKEQNFPCMSELDYFIVGFSEREQELDDWDIYFYSTTKHGGCEGIYTDFFIRRNGKEIEFATAKTLSEDDNSFINMHVFAAKFVILANNYVENHEDEFNWRGFDVKLRKNERPYGGWWCPTEEKAKQKADEILSEEKDVKIIIRDNRTRKVTEYN